MLAIVNGTGGIIDAAIFVTGKVMNDLHQLGAILLMVRATVGATAATATISSSSQHGLKHGLLNPRSERAGASEKVAHVSCTCTIYTVYF